MKQLELIGHIAPPCRPAREGRGLKQQLTLRLGAVTLKQVSRGRRSGHTSKLHRLNATGSEGGGFCINRDHRRDRPELGHRGATGGRMPWCALTHIFCVSSQRPNPRPTIIQISGNDDSLPIFPGHYYPLPRLRDSPLDKASTRLQSCAVALQILLPHPGVTLRATLRAIQRVKTRISVHFRRINAPFSGATKSPLSHWPRGL